MGNRQQLLQRAQTLDVNDTSELCILGVLFDDARSENGLMSVIRGMDIGTWQPTREVVFSTLERLVAQNCIVTLEGTHDQFFSITGEGIKRFFKLIKRPLPFDMGMRTNSVAMKSYFLEQVPCGVRKCVVSELIGYYNCQLRGLQDGCALCPLNSQRKSMQNQQQLGQIQQELTWLQGLTSELGRQQAVL